MTRGRRRRRRGRSRTRGPPSSWGRGRRALFLFCLLVGWLVCLFVCSFVCFGEGEREREREKERVGGGKGAQGKALFGKRELRRCRRRRHHLALPPCKKKVSEKPTKRSNAKLTLFRLQEDLHVLWVGVGPRGGHAGGQEREREEDEGCCCCFRRRRRRCPRPRDRGRVSLRRRHSFKGK